MSWNEIFALLFVTIGPVRPSLAFLALTMTAEPSLKRAIAIRAVSVAALVIVIFTLLGARVLANWRVSVDALLIAGGVILFVSALQMVIGEEKPAPEGPPPTPTVESGIFPLASPTIATPHGLVAIVAIEATLQGTSETMMLIGMILGLMVLNFLFLIFAHRIFAKIPPPVLKIVPRVLGILLSAMAVQFIIFGFDGLGLIPNPEIDVNN